VFDATCLPLAANYGWLGSTLVWQLLQKRKRSRKKLLQELRNRCRDHYNVVADGTMPEAVDVRETNQKLEELVLLLDGKAKWDDAKSSD
jgi:acetyl-CoA carboxylase carboxyltransferase component